MPSKLPWESVKAESLRSICADLGRRLSTRAEMIDFLGTVEAEGLEAALAVSPSVSKRKAARPPKETAATSDEPESNHRPKRVRRSIGQPTTPAKSQRDERAEERSSKKFDGVVLSRRRSGRHSKLNDQETNGENYNEDGAEAVAGDLEDGHRPNLKTIDSKIIADTALSSGSDKENAPVAEDIDVDADADGEAEHDNPNDISVDIPVGETPPV